MAKMSHGRAMAWLAAEAPDRPAVVHGEETATRAELERRRSPIVQAYLHRIPNDWTVDVGSTPNPQYTAGGPEALIDGLRGGRDQRQGKRRDDGSHRRSPCGAGTLADMAKRGARM